MTSTVLLILCSALIGFAVVAGTIRVVSAATVAVNPQSGPIGTKVTVSGTGFNTAVQVYFSYTSNLNDGGANLATCPSSGSFACPIVVPSDATVGMHYVLATTHNADQGLVSAYTPFQVTSQGFANSTTTTIISSSTTKINTTSTKATCPTMSLTEGLAPAAPTTGDTNIYINLVWGGQIPAGGLSVVFRSTPGPAGTAFLFNPVTMFSAKLSVLMDVTTIHTIDGVYTVTVTATVLDPQSNQMCSASANVNFTVSGSTVFTTTLGQTTGSALWPTGLPAPLLITGTITASQFSDVKPNLDQNSHILTLDFTVTGPAGTAGAATLTIPKSDLPPGVQPRLTEDGVPVPNQILTEDANSYFLAFMTQFSTHTFQVGLVQTPQSTSSVGSSSSSAASSSTNSSATTTSPGPSIDGVQIVSYIAAPVIILAIAALFVSRRRERMGKVSSAGPVSPNAPGGFVRAKYCSKCGQAAGSSETYCTNCGASLMRAR